jgi:tetratricopeptide (TPR) repeat protein
MRRAMSDPVALARIDALFRRGDLAAARAEGEALLRTRPGDPALLDLVGTISCHAGDLAGGAEFLRRALTIAPEQLPTRIALANALALMGDAAGAEALCTSDAPELLRLRGYLLQSQLRFAEAADCYEQIVVADPTDWEIWNNLGNARRAASDLPGALDALNRARQLRPDLAPIQLNYAMSLAAAGRLEESLEPCARAARLEPRNPVPALELGRLLCNLGRHSEALESLRRAAALAPGEVETQVELGRAHAGLGELAEAEAAYRIALRLRPNHALAFLELGIVLERGNRVDRLEPLLQDAEAQGVPAADLAYLHALRLRSEGRIEEALAAAHHASADVQPERRAQLIGQLADRAGDPATAFEAFREANAIAAKEPAAAAADAEGYFRRVRSLNALVTPHWYASWPPAVPSDRPSPVFLVGFPRSGTTLLETILMGHEEVAVLDEEPILQRVGDILGGFEQLPGLDVAEIARLRTLYFEELDRLLPDAGGKVAVDKLPLNLLRAPLIHRLFPDARIVFAQRHPCDVVLSCFMQSFVINDAMANFLDLGDAARLYDVVLTFWETCRDVLPLAVHTVRYEALVEDLEGDARALLDFLGLPWDAAVLDHSRTARGRGLISTPSYSQVIQPLYREASGRWTRYRAEMAPVLPVLAPWALRLGYGDILDPER